MSQRKPDVPTLASFEWKLDGEKVQFTGLQVNGIPEGPGYCDNYGTKFEGIWSKGKLNGVMKTTGAYHGLYSLIKYSNGYEGYELYENGE